MARNDEKLYNINSYVFFGAGSYVLRRVIECGFPAIERGGRFYIKGSDIFAIRKAADEIRKEYGKVSIIKARELARKALKYLAEGDNDQAY